MKTIFTGMYLAFMYAKIKGATWLNLLTAAFVRAITWVAVRGLWSYRVFNFEHFVSMVLHVMSFIGAGLLAYFALSSGGPLGFVAAAIMGGSMTAFSAVNRLAIFMDEVGHRIVAHEKSVEASKALVGLYVLEQDLLTAIESLKTAESASLEVLEAELRATNNAARQHDIREMISLLKALGETGGMEAQSGLLVRIRKDITEWNDLVAECESIMRTGK